MTATCSHCPAPFSCHRYCELIGCVPGACMSQERPAWCGGCVGRGGGGSHASRRLEKLGCCSSTHTLAPPPPERVLPLLHTRLNECTLCTVVDCWVAFSCQSALLAPCHAQGRSWRHTDIHTCNPPSPPPPGRARAPRDTCFSPRTRPHHSPAPCIRPTCSEKPRGLNSPNHYHHRDEARRVVCNTPKAQFQPRLRAQGLPPRASMQAGRRGRGSGAAGQQACGGQGFLGLQRRQRGVQLGGLDGHPRAERAGRVLLFE